MGEVIKERRRTLNITQRELSEIAGVSVNTLTKIEQDEAAYLTRRFDVLPDGRHLRKEDFASLAGVTADGARTDLKDRSS